jgi:hypothetical protein
MVPFYTLSSQFVTLVNDCQASEEKAILPSAKCVCVYKPPGEDSKVTQDSLESALLSSANPRFLFRK